MTISDIIQFTVGFIIGILIYQNIKFLWRNKK